MNNQPLRWIFFISLSFQNYLPSAALKETSNCKCGEINDLNSRIIGGTEISEHKYPWLVIILKRNRFHCGGSVINNWYILTAAHCITKEGSDGVATVFSISDLEVVLGAHDKENESERSKQYYKVAELKYPRRIYNCKLHELHDIALMKVHKEINFNWAISPVCLPPPNSFDYVGKQAIVSGWGMTTPDGQSSRFPLEANQTILDNDACLSAVDVGSHFAENPLAMFCGYKKHRDACKGDSGGPVVVEEKNKVTQIGIVSWGMGCAQVNYPGIFTRLPYYIDWINENTEDAVYCTSD